jgi:hypothetical protein
MQFTARMNDDAVALRNGFIRKVGGSGTVWVVAGSDGLARFPSQRWKGREVTLMWSDKVDAERWASTVADRPRLKQLTTLDLFVEVLPALERLKRFVGTDWGPDPVEPEIEARELGERLRLEAVDDFVARVAGSRKLYVLEDADGPAMLVSQQDPAQRTLPCWATWEEAEARIEGPFCEMLSCAIPLASFLERTLPWLEGEGRRIAPAHFWGPGAIELEPADLAGRLKDKLGSRAA